MGMSRKKFKNNLVQAIESKDYYVDDETIEKFLDLNYDEDSSITEWEYEDFNNFAHELCHAWGNFWEAVREFDLNVPAEKYLIKNIKYSIENEDISAYLEERDSSNLEPHDYSEEEWEEARKEIQDSLPQSFIVEIDPDYDDLEEALNNAISDETGWCIETYEAEEVK